MDLLFLRRHTYLNAVIAVNVDAGIVHMDSEKESGLKSRATKGNEPWGVLSLTGKIINQSDLLIIS